LYIPRRRKRTEEEEEEEEDLFKADAAEDRTQEGNVRCCPNPRYEVKLKV